MLEEYSMKVLATGSNGYIDSVLVPLLAGVRYYNEWQLSSVGVRYGLTPSANN